MNILHMLTEFQHLCFAESRAIDTEKEQAQRAQELFETSADSPAFKAAIRIRTAIQDARMSCAKEIIDVFKNASDPHHARLSAAIANGWHFQQTISSAGTNWKANRKHIHSLARKTLEEVLRFSELQNTDHKD